MFLVSYAVHLVFRWVLLVMVAFSSNFLGGEESSATNQGLLGQGVVCCVAAMLDLEEKRAHPSSQRLVNRGFLQGGVGETFECNRAPRD